MSSDVMIVCKEIGTTFDGDNTEDAIFVDEASIGEPWSEFGIWIQDYIWKMGANGYCLSGYDINVIIRAVKIKLKHKDLNEKEFIKEIQNLNCKRIKTENW